MDLGTYVDRLLESLKTVFSLNNKMTADKANSLTRGFVKAEVDAAHKFFLEHAELNKSYQYIKTTKKKRIYDLDTTLLKIYEVNYFSEFRTQPLDKIFKEDFKAAKSISNPDINPTYYEDYSDRGKIVIYPSPQYDDEIIEIFGLFETVDLSADADLLKIPTKYYSQFRNYLIAKIQIMAGVGVDQENLNTVHALRSLEKSLKAEAIECRRDRDFYNPNRKKFVEGSI